MRHFLRGLIAAALLGGAAHAHSALDTVEHLFGASNVNAITGHGRLAIGVSAAGELTVLTWPNASQTDQLAYIASNAFEARDLPRFGAPEAAGAFLGLVLEDAAGARAVRWLRADAGWAISQRYAGDGANVETVYAAADLTVTVTDAVDPVEAGEADRLVRHVRVERAAGADVAAAWLLVYANLSPSPPNNRVPELPIADWAYDGRNDFAALWDASIGAAVHFHPADQNVRDSVTSLLAAPAVDYGPLGAALRAGAPDAEALAGLAADLDAAYAPGAYLALTTVPAPDQHQIGQDATPLCAAAGALLDNFADLKARFPDVPLPIDPMLLDVLRCPEGPPLAEREGFVWQADDAWADAADGELAGHGLAVGEANSALRAPLTFEGDVATGAVVLVAAPTAAEVQAALTDGPAPAEVLTRSDAALAAWLETIDLPDHPDLSDHVKRVTRRALINIRVGHVASNGAIVASITRQAPYGLDWPRDGAFFNALLDGVGWSDLVTRRADLYLGWQRDRAAVPTPLVDVPPPIDPDTGRRSYPAGAWEMNYYADGAPGGTFRFEIDNAGFALWTLVAHAAWTDDPAAYLNARWDGIKAAADLLTRWRDAETGLPAPAQEDDNPAYTQTLHGAVTTFGALDMAARGARLAGHDDDAERWEARAKELGDTILERFYDAEARRFTGHSDVPWNPGSAPTGQTAWLVWPAHLLPWDDARVAAQMEVDLDTITPIVNLETEGGAYVVKTTSSAALALGADPAFRPRLIALLEALALHATPGTDQFGEVFLAREGPDGVFADQRVSTPHLWEGALFAATALALASPDAMLRYEAVLPPSRVRGTLGQPDPAPDAGVPDAAPPTDAAPPADAAAPVADAGGAPADGAPDAETACLDCEDDGCDCDATDGGPANGLALLALALWGLRRRYVIRP